MREYGAEPERARPAATVAQPVKVDNDLYVRDYSRCVLCYKCVEACGTDAQNTFAIAVAGRGFDAHISTESDRPLPDSACVYCGNCIGVCPTGALMFKSEHDMRQAGTWDESKQTVTDTICPYCGVGCTLQLHVQDNDIVRVTSPLDHDVTSGHSVSRAASAGSRAEPLSHSSRRQEGSVRLQPDLVGRRLKPRDLQRLDVVFPSIEISQRQQLRIGGPHLRRRHAAGSDRVEEKHGPQAILRQQCFDMRQRAPSIDRRQRMREPSISITAMS